MKLKELAERILALPEEEQDKKAWFYYQDVGCWEIDNIEPADTDSVQEALESDLNEGDFILTP